MSKELRKRARSQNILIAAGVALLAVIAIAVSYPYFAAWRIQHRVEAAIAQQRSTEASTQAVLDQVTAEVISATPFVEVSSLPEPSYEGKLVVRVSNAADAVVTSINGHLVVRAATGENVADVPFMVIKPIAAHGQREVPAVIRSAFTWPPSSLKADLRAETLTFGGGRVISKK